MTKLPNWCRDALKTSRQNCQVEIYGQVVYARVAREL